MAYFIQYAVSNFTLKRCIPKLVLLQRKLITVLYKVPLKIPMETIPTIAIRTTDTITLLELLACSIFVEIKKTVPIPMAIKIGKKRLPTRPFHRAIKTKSYAVETGHQGLITQSFAAINISKTNSDKVKHSQ